MGLWSALLITRQVPEIEEGDKSIWFHLAAEYLLGVGLAIAGALLLFVGDGAAIRIGGPLPPSEVSSTETTFGDP